MEMTIEFLQGRSSSYIEFKKQHFCEMTVYHIVPLVIVISISISIIIAVCFVITIAHISFAKIRPWSVYRDRYR